MIPWLVWSRPAWFPSTTRTGSGKPWKWKPRASTKRAALAARSFADAGYPPTSGSELEIEVKARAVMHTITLNRVRAWTRLGKESEGQGAERSAERVDVGDTHRSRTFSVQNVARKVLKQRRIKMFLSLDACAYTLGMFRTQTRRP